MCLITVRRGRAWTSTGWAAAWCDCASIPCKNIEICYSIRLEMGMRRRRSGRLQDFQRNQPVEGAVIDQFNIVVVQHSAREHKKSAADKDAPTRVGQIGLYLQHHQWSQIRKRCRSNSLDFIEAQIPVKNQPQNKNVINAAVRCSPLCATRDQLGADHQNLQNFQLIQMRKRRWWNRIEPVDVETQMTQRRQLGHGQRLQLTYFI